MKERKVGWFLAPLIPLKTCQPKKQGGKGAFEVGSLAGLRRWAKGIALKIHPEGKVRSE